MTKSSTRRQVSTPGNAHADDTEERAGHFAAYSEHANILRTWLVAYGIGPVLILSQEKVWNALAKAHYIRVVAALFLFGVVLQVLLATLNKSVMWACYYGDANPEYKWSRCQSLYRDRLGVA